MRTADRKLNHWYFEQGTGSWGDGGRFGSDILMSGPAFIQSRHGTVRNFDLVCVRNDGRLQHWWRDNDNSGVWIAGSIFGSGVGDTSVCMIEGEVGRTDENSPGNCELCVAVNGQLQHWWRDTSPPRQGNPDEIDPPDWHFGGAYGSGAKHVRGLVEGSFNFNLDVIVERDDGALQFWYRAGNQWTVGSTIDT